MAQSTLGNMFENALPFILTFQARRGGSVLVSFLLFSFTVTSVFVSGTMRREFIEMAFERDVNYLDRPFRRRLLFAFRVSPFFSCRAEHKNCVKLEI